MLTHIEIGKKGEDLAVDFLRKQSYRILEQNWRYSRAEIDIIALKENILVFVEVKTRSSEFYGPPEEFVNRKKQQLLSTAASAYMEEKNHTWIIRFDIITVLLDGQRKTKITHFEDAFFLGLENDQY